MTLVKTLDPCTHLKIEELILEHGYPSSTGHNRIVSLLTKDWSRAFFSLTPAPNNLSRPAVKGQFWPNISLSENNCINHCFPKHWGVQYWCSHPQMQCNKCYQQTATFKYRRSLYLPLWFWLYFHCCKTNLNSLVVLYSPLHPNRGSYDTTTSVGQWKLEKERGKRNNLFFITVGFSREVVWCSIVWFQKVEQTVTVFNS